MNSDIWLTIAAFAALSAFVLFGHQLVERTKWITGSIKTTDGGRIPVHVRRCPGCNHPPMVSRTPNDKWIVVCATAHPEHDKRCVCVLDSPRTPEYDTWKEAIEAWNSMR